ncbi:TPA: hypothetical protein ACPSKB_001714 [Legionella feeleii]
MPRSDIVVKRKSIEDVSLHEIPLFAGSQTVEWQKDGHTNQLNRLVVAINRGADGKGKIKYNTIDEIIYNIQEIWTRAQLPFPNESFDSESFFSKYWPLLKEAIAKHAKVHDLSYQSSALDEEVSDGWVKLQIFKRKLSDASLTIETPDELDLVAKKPEDDLERVVDSLDALEQSYVINERKQQLTRDAINKHIDKSGALVPPSIFVGRLFVGCGYAGMTLMTTDPSIPKSAVKAFKQLQHYVSTECSGPLCLETLVISEQEVGHWTSADHRAEQEHPLLEIPGNATANDFIPKSQSLGRTLRTNTRHLFYANTVNMALKDTPPPFCGVSVQALERREKHLDDWHVEATVYHYRLKVSIPQGNKTLTAYIYAQFMDFSLGMGIGQNTSFENALQYEFVRQSREISISSGMGKSLYQQYSTYDSKRGFTPMLHGNEYDLSSRERQCSSDVKSRRVVVIGGAGGAATAYRIAVLGTDLHGYRLLNENGELVKDGKGLRQNPNVKIFARGKVTYNNLAVQATESFEHAKAKKNLFENFLLVGIKKAENGEIVLRFHKREGAREIEKTTALHFKKMMQDPGRHSRRVIPEIVEDNGKFFILNRHEEVCDQLISGMGQDASKIRGLILSEVRESELRTVRGRDGHIVALTTVSGEIRLNGAMAGNVTRQFTEDLAVSLKKSTLPRNGNDQNIMPCVLGKLFSFFSARQEEPKLRRVSINVNTCFLQRGDLRDEKTEFQEFLEHAGLASSEITKFVEFLLKERTTDLSGAGVSFEKLTSYLKLAKIDNRVQIISSCTLIATKDLGPVDLKRSRIDEPVQIVSSGTSIATENLTSVSQI